MVFGADLIAGFPTETDAMFADTVDLIDACGLTYIHAFPYSARPGTPAARMPPVDPAAIKARAARLRAIGTDRLADHCGRQAGRIVSVLAERGGKGHAEDFSAVRLPSGVPPGAIVALAVTGHDGRVLGGDLVDPSSNRSEDFR